MAKLAETLGASLLSSTLKNKRVIRAGEGAAATSKGKTF